MAPAELRRSRTWAGLKAGDPVQVDAPRLRGLRATWSFVAFVMNAETGEEWVEVVGGRPGDRAVRSFPLEQIYAAAARPGHDLPLVAAPGLPLE